MTGYAQAEVVPNTKGCWYLIDIEECPACGRGKEYRTRMPPPRPTDDSKRVRFEFHWDWCEL